LERVKYLTQRVGPPPFALVISGLLVVLTATPILGASSYRTYRSIGSSSCVRHTLGKRD